LSEPRAIIRDNKTLFNRYSQLQKNDIVCTRICLKPGEEPLLADLCERGIHLIPSAAAQLASRSKCFQARLFSDFMLPGTLPIYDSNTLLKATSYYRQHKYARVVLKRDRKNAGLGVYIFNDIEDLYNQVVGGSCDYPFVVQPFQERSRDIRVIILDDYVEAYERTNPYNFRKNLHCGGTSAPYSLSESQLLFCRQVMERGRFAYAHIDLILNPKGDHHLMEINLRGGLKGARICSRNYKDKLDSLCEALLRELKNTLG